MSRNNNSQQQYPNLLKECEVLTTDILAKTVGADPLDIQSTFVGAICRWQAANPAGLIDITRFWFEQGSLSNERKVADFLKYKVESRHDRGRQFDCDAPRRPERRVRCGQRRGGRGRLVGQPSSARHRRVRAGDQAHGADAGHQLVGRSSARNVERRSARLRRVPGFSSHRPRVSTAIADVGNFLRNAFHRCRVGTIGARQADRYRLTSSVRARRRARRRRCRRPR